MSYLKVHDDHVVEDAGHSNHVVYLASYLGEVEISICDVCEYEQVTCSHAANVWNKDGTNLTCALCGADGT